MTERPENSAVLQGLTQAVAAAPGKARLDSQLEEFEDCRYFLLSEPKSDAVLLSFASAYPLPEESLQAVKHAYDGTAQLRSTAQEGYQVTLKVPLAALRSLAEQERQERLCKLSKVRLVAVGAPLRPLLCTMGSGTFLSRPNAPFFVLTTPDAATVLFPIWLRDARNSVLTMAFVQEFVEARRGLCDAPQCAVTHPGQALPIQLSPEQVHHLGGFKGSFLSLVLLPRHISSDAKMDEVVWSLLTFYAFLDAHVRSFKALIHTCMRKNADSLLATMEATQANPKRAKKLVQKPAVLLQSRCVVPPAMYNETN